MRGKGVKLGGVQNAARDSKKFLSSSKRISMQNKTFARTCASVMDLVFLSPLLSYTSKRLLALEASIQQVNEAPRAIVWVCCVLGGASGLSYSCVERCNAWCRGC